MQCTCITIHYISVTLYFSRQSWLVQHNIICKTMHEWGQIHKRFAHVRPYWLEPTVTQRLVAWESLLLDMWEKKCFIRWVWGMKNKDSSSRTSAIPPRSRRAFHCLCPQRLKGCGISTVLICTLLVCGLHHRPSLSKTFLSSSICEVWSSAAAITRSWSSCRRSLFGHWKWEGLPCWLRVFMLPVFGGCSSLPKTSSVAHSCNSTCLLL